jgi:hypothetical protein
MVIFWDGEVIILQNTVFYLAGDSAALRYAGEYLEFSGAQIAQCPDDRVTHLLLPVPSFENGRVKGGWKLEPILATLPGDITVIGGNADHPALARYCRLDLLQDPFYLAENADITAHCAVKLALSRLPVSLKNQSVLVIGWGALENVWPDSCALWVQRLLCRHESRPIRPCSQPWVMLHPRPSTNTGSCSTPSQP